MAVTADGRSIKTEERSSRQGVTSLASRRLPRSRQSWIPWLINNSTRLAIWYALFTIVFRCPSSTTELDETSPRVCPAYLTAKGHVQPYIQPYYDTHARPYVDFARPYLQQANTKVVQPAAAVAVGTYEKHYAPPIRRARDYLYREWEKQVMPQVLLAQGQARAVYDNNVAHYIDQASAAVGPYYKQAKDNVLSVHQTHVIPTIVQSRPHFERALAALMKFVLGTAVPSIQHAWSNTIIFVDGTLWPFVKGLYSDNVRPQLVMISERIAKYQESRRLQSVIDEVDASTNTPPATTDSPSLEEVTETIVATDTTTSSLTLESVSSSVSSSGLSEPTVATDETISQDLAKWQKKFALAADRGADDLRERTTDLIVGLSKSEIDGEGRGLALALEKTVEVELDKIRAKIKIAAQSLPEGASSMQIDSTENDLVQSIRAAGVEIKGRAVAVRQWSHRFETELEQRLSLAAESTLQVLDSIRDLGLQEIGMRWAWMEGVTYKHWQKYHDLRKRFEDWRQEVRDVAVKNERAESVRETARQMLEESMAVTEQAAKGLVQLKSAAKWKIRARDDSDDFEARAVSAAVVSAASSVVSALQAVTSVSGAASQDPTERPSSQMKSRLSEAGASGASVARVASDGAASALSGASDLASSAVSGSSTGVVESATSSIATAAESVAKAVSSSASSLISGTEASSLASNSLSLGSKGSVMIDEAGESASSLTASGTLPPSDAVFSSGSSTTQAASSSIRSAYDHIRDESYSEKILEMVNEAGDKASEVTSSMASAYA